MHWQYALAIFNELYNIVSSQMFCKLPVLLSADCRITVVSFYLFTASMMESKVRFVGSRIISYESSY
jgi:hypothetical protein